MIKTVLKFMIAILLSIAIFLAAVRGAGFSACNVDAYGFKADQVSLVFSSETAKAPVLTCPKKAKAVKVRR